MSAERIRRHLERGTPPDAASLKIIRNCADTIGSSVQTVRTLVDEFSTLARFPASRPVPSDINQIVESALLMFDGRLSGIRVQKLLAPDLPAVHADPDAIKRAIANLVDNAAEAMQQSMVKEIAISTALAGERDTVEIVVSDTGHGVTPAVKEKLFLPYFSTKKRGTGLGLAIVSRIIEDHHGSIRVEENSPIGTRFIVELPVAAAMAADALRYNMHTILIVDDESEIRSSLQGVLEDEGYKTILAESAEDCLATLSRKPVDVVLLDIWLPGIDGLEALERIVEMDDPPEVIMISGHGNIETAVRATKLGAFDFLEKPLSIERTLIVLKNAIDAKRLRSENLEYRKQFQARSVIVGDSIPMKALRQQIALMAPTNGRVLIYGESGTGKELVARAIHAQSLRKDEMFVEVNCAAIPEDLIESELFGHRAGVVSRRQLRQGRQVSEGRRRHAVPRRSRRHEPEDAVEGAAHARRGALRSGGRGRADHGGCARDCRHEQRPGRRNLQRAISAKTCFTG